MVIENEIEKPLEEWKYAYVAGAVDFGSNLSILTQKNDSWKFNHSISLDLRISSEHSGSLSFIGKFCREHDLNARIRERKDAYRLEISRRDDIRDFLKLLEEYLISRHEASEIILNELLPLLEGGKTTTKEDFIHIVSIADKVREKTSTRGNAKYDEQYFREKWDINGDNDSKT